MITSQARRTSTTRSMLTRLRQPGGAVGVLSVAATVTFAAAGTLGLASMLIPVATDSDLWSDQRDRVLGVVIFGLMIAGAVGFLVMNRQPLLGVALAILGCIGLAVILFWTIVPVVLGVVFGVAAVKRAAFHGRAAHA